MKYSGKAGALLLKVAVCLVLFLGMGRVSEGATHHVYANGSGNFATIQAAANAANAGDVIVVHSGTYNERVTVTRGGTSTSPIVFQSEPRRTAIMKGFDLNAANVHVKGFDITSTSTGLAGCGVIIRKDGAWVDDCFIHDMMEKAVLTYWSTPWPNNGKITNNYCKDNGGGIEAKGTDWLVENNEIDRMLQKVSGLDVDYSRLHGQNVVFRGNYFHGTNKSEVGTAHVDGFQTFDNSGSYLINALIENNVVMDCHEGMMAESKYTDVHRDVTIRNNIFARCWAWGLDLHGMDNIKVYHNIFYDMGVHGIGFRTGTTGECKNNIFYTGNYWKEADCTVDADRNLLYKPGTTWSQTEYPKDIVNRDPMFANAAAGDFTPKAGSPLIDAGVNVGVEKDRIGTTRPQGAQVDIGPIEVISGSTPTQPSVSVGDISLNEGNSGSVFATFTVTLSAASTQIVSVNYATSDGTATVTDSDYASAAGTLSISAGSTSKTIAVLVNGDTKVEANETFVLNLSSPINATIADGQATATINNDDAAAIPAVSIAPASVDEGNSGTTPMVFNVTLSSATTSPVSVNYATSDGTATVADTDYTAASGTVSFAVGVTSRTITVNVIGDTRPEGAEYLNVTLSSAVNATLGTNKAAGTIVCEDPLLTRDVIGHWKLDDASGVAVADSSPSGNNGQLSTGASWCSGALDGAVDIASSTAYAQVGTKNMNAQSGSVALWCKPRSFSAAPAYLFGHTTSPSWGSRIQVYINDAAGNLCVGLGDSHSNAVNVQALQLNTWTHVAVTWSAGSYKVFVNGAVKATGAYTGLTTISNIADIGNNGHPSWRVEGFDGQIDDVQVYNCALLDTEVLELATLPVVPAISINDVSSPEGNSGSSNFTFDVSLSQACSKAISVNYATVGATAVAGSDFTAKGGTINFPAGSTTQQVSIPVTGDSIHELNELFTVQLSNPVNATIADDKGNGTIQNDDAAPKLAINDVSVLEGNSGTQAMVFTVSLTGSTAIDASCSFATSDGTATAASGDYVATSGSVTIPAGSTSATISVTINGDSVEEANETFNLTLSNGVRATFADVVGVGTIQNDDKAVVLTPSATVTDCTVAERDSGSGWATVFVKLDKPSSTLVTLRYDVNDATAMAGSDYIDEWGTLKFKPGVTELRINVAVIGDRVRESTETFQIVLSNPSSGVAIADGTGVVTINDND